MKFSLFLIGIFIIGYSISSVAQEERKFIRKGNNAYDQKKYETAAAAYRQGVEANAYSYEANFNLGNALYQQGEFESASQQFDLLRQPGMDKNQLAKVYHNLGNSFLEQQKYPESIEAYKEALRNNPADADTRYNLVYAMKKLQEPEQQNQQNQDNQQNEENQDQQNQNQNQDQEEQQKNPGENQNQDQQNQSGQDEQQNQQQQEQEKQQQHQQDQEQQQAEPSDEISRQELERILQALQMDEKKLHDNMKKKKMKGQRVKIQKDW